MVSKVNMAVDLGGIKMKNPINTASGTYGFGWQFEGFYDVSRLGAITTKGCAAEPWPGNPAPRMAEVTSGMMNSVGLQNPGVRGLVDSYGEYLQQLSDKGTQVICQVAGHSVDEYVRAVDLFEELAPFAAGLEINISCPNIAAGGCAMGSTPEGAAEVIRAVRSHTKRPLLVKMAPARVVEVAQALEAEGADALTVINSIPGMAIDVDTRRSRLSRPTGGMSGPALHPIAVRMVWEVHNAVNIPIVGVGGVMTGRDAAEFILAGATSVSVGMANLVDPTAAPRILDELSEWAESQGVSDINELIGAFEG
ncbi:dihydroorotate dehydrogenase [Parolsenella catena]|uniref:dihydroorotate dehydrogenase n=1 Tax=Parolsenella catena TaxID=2003188 RepID=UPI00294224F8|nr:dihydroorotate dehydrogenase [Parolsenella catena]